MQTSMEIYRYYKVSFWFLGLPVLREVSAKYTDISEFDIDTDISWVW